MSKNTVTHPLLNPDSKHYQMVDGVEAITRLEEMYSPKELATWAKITAMKYRLRVGNKDEVVKEVVKIKGYEAYYKYLTVERSVPDVDIDEDLYNACEMHNYHCPCFACRKLNAIDNKLMDVKRNYIQDAGGKDASTATSKESKEKVIEEVIKAFFGNPLRRAEVWKDSKLFNDIRSASPNAGSHSKIRVKRYIIGSFLDEIIGKGDGDELPSSEEPFKVTEVQSDSDRRSSPMDRRVPEDVSAMERFERAYEGHADSLQFGDINPREFRELISNAFTEFMESVGKVSDGQAGLAVQ